MMMALGFGPIDATLLINTLPFDSGLETSTRPASTLAGPSVHTRLLCQFAGIFIYQFEDFQFGQTIT